MSKKQSGFAHLMIIVAILSVALIGILGFVFWQNFMQPKTVSKSSSTSSSVKVDTPLAPDPSQVALTEVAFDHSSNSGFAIKYPETWTLEHTSVNTSEGVGDNNIVSSPDGNITVSLYASMMGVGGTCDPTDKTVYITQIARYPISNYSGHTVYESVVKGYNGSYYMNANVLEDNQYNKAVKVGDSPCNLGIGIFNDRNGKPSSVNLRVKSLESQNKSLNDINSVTSSVDFAVAIRIMQSLYVR